MFLFFFSFLHTSLCTSSSSPSFASSPVFFFSFSELSAFRNVSPIPSDRGGRDARQVARGPRADRRCVREEEKKRRRGEGEKESGRDSGGAAVALRERRRESFFFLSTSTLLLHGPRSTSIRSLEMLVHPIPLQRKRRGAQSERKKSKNRLEEKRRRATKKSTLTPLSLSFSPKTPTADEADAAAKLLALHMEQAGVKADRERLAAVQKGE